MCAVFPQAAVRSEGRIESLYLQQCKQVGSAMLAETVFTDDKQRKVRVFREDNLLLFVARDILSSLDFSQKAINNIGKSFSSVPEEWKRYRIIPTNSGRQTALLVSEAGMFYFLFRSNKPKALGFSKWVAHQVTHYTGADTSNGD
ncbi:BRO-N domain-containing protein [Desulfovibrio sp. An276]|uniref:BRO-N domain-containing protein n=1 Tax=Desulfovibrio sp. An276 TaxID=1965618 RepID=UPI001EF65681|nr:Bro-N domain-containing protein [Desulfovibrio sp. An276]